MCLCRRHQSTEDFTEPAQPPAERSTMIQLRLYNVNGASGWSDVCRLQAKAAENLKSDRNPTSQTMYIQWEGKSLLFDFLSLDCGFWELIFIFKH